MTSEIKTHIRAGSTWLRGFYILLFAVIYGIAEFVIGAVVVFQFLFTLFTGRTNQRLLSLGQGLSTFIYEVMLFLTYNSDDKPFPFSDWPKGPPAAPGGEGAGRTKTASTTTSRPRSKVKAKGQRKEPGETKPKE